MKTRKKNINLFMMFFFLSFHNYVSKNAFARYVLFSHFRSLFCELNFCFSLDNCLIFKILLYSQLPSIFEVFPRVLRIFKSWL